MTQWEELMAGQTFITDLGVESACVGRYAVWSPLRSGQGHGVVEVGRELDELMARYHIPRDRVCVLES